MNQNTPEPLKLIFFCRGSLDGGRNDRPLDGKGRKQIILSAREVSEKIDFNIPPETLIISSPANATMQSAAEIAKVLGITRTIEESPFLSLGLVGEWISRLMEQNLKTLPKGEPAAILVSDHRALEFLAAALLPKDKVALFGPDKIRDGQYCIVEIPDRTALGQAFEQGVSFEMGEIPKVLGPDHVTFFRHAKSMPMKVGEALDSVVTGEGYAELEASIEAYITQYAPAANKVRIYTSPLSRARQTASFIAQTLGYDPHHIVISSALAEKAAVQSVRRFIEEELFSMKNMGAAAIVVAHDPTSNEMFRQIVKGEYAEVLHRLKEGQYCTFAEQAAAFGPNPQLGDAAELVCAQQ